MNELRRHSKKRDVILEVLCSTKTHPTAQWIYEKSKKQIPGLSLATVYRNIRQLKNDGLAISVGIVEGEERFDGFNKPHPHFICERCGCVIDLDYQNKFSDCAIEDGNHINYLKTVFYGTCKDCFKDD